MVNPSFFFIFIAVEIYFGLAWCVALNLFISCQIIMDRKIRERQQIDSKDVDNEYLFDEKSWYDDDNGCGYETSNLFSVRLTRKHWTVCCTTEVQTDSLI